MKKTFLTIALAVLSVVSVKAQEQTQKEHQIFCQIVGAEKGLFSSKLNVYIDFGLNSHAMKNVIVDGYGNKITFNTMIDALNYMGEHGWTFVQAYTITHGNQNVYHYLFSKNIVGNNVEGNIITKEKYKKIIKTVNGYTHTYIYKD